MTSYISGILLKPFCARCKSKGTLKPVPAVLLQWANLLPGIHCVAPADARWDALCGHIFGVVFASYWPPCPVCACRLWSQALAPDSCRLSGVLWNSLRAGTASGKLEDNWEVSLLNIDSNFTVFSESEPLTGVRVQVVLRNWSYVVQMVGSCISVWRALWIHWQFSACPSGSHLLASVHWLFPAVTTRGACLPMALVGLPLEWARR